jgi:hypothetical protein
MKSFLAGDRGGIPTRCVWDKLSIFNTLGKAGFYRKLFVLRSLEGKFLKTENLRRLVRAIEPGATPQVWAQHTTLKDRVVG